MMPAGISRETTTMNATDRRIARCCLAALILGFHISDAAAAAPLEAYGATPHIANVQLNPKGDMLAWSDHSGAEPMVVMFDLATRTQKRRLGIDADAKLRSLTWADDETLLINVSITNAVGAGIGSVEYEWLRTLAVASTGGPTRILLMTDQERSWVTGADVVALRPQRPKTVIMASWDYSATAARGSIDSRLGGGSGWIYNLFEVDTRTGKGKLIDHGSHLTDTWVVNRTGRSVARSEWDSEHRIFRLQARDAGGWREIHQQTDGEALALFGLTQDESAVIALGANGQPLRKLWAIPLDGSGARILVEDAQYDVEAVVRDGYSSAVTGAWIGGPAPALRWIDAQSEGRHKALARSFAGRGVSIYGRSADASRVLARVGDHATPVVYYLVDFSKGTADIVGDHYPALEKVRHGEVRSLTYKARDGYDIPAYVTLPPDMPAEKLPLVVMPHGGPEARDDTEFDSFAQFLASRGYAVLQPQFRGSTGFGEAHRLAGYAQWGGLMQDDVSDGVKALVEQGLADAQRVCIVGLSYGGYSALAGAVFTPELYACAASINGVSDLPAMLGHVAKKHGKESDSLNYWRRHIGGGAGDAHVVARSPARAAHSVKAPILLIHGADDTIVPMTQSEAMARALGAAGKRHTLVKLSGEDHWLSRSETRIRVLKELDAFLAEHLGAASAQSAGAARR
jgi:dipeptidyl aminopeptidase/acylaminoacyl peptidase